MTNKTVVGLSFCEGKMLFTDFCRKISNIDKDALKDKARRCRGDILSMTSISGSGHPGGSMSTIDSMLAVYSVANISPEKANDPERDLVFVSHGHVSPAVYSCLAVNGFFPEDDAVSQFRKAGSIYEGHIERNLKGVEWTSGNLGQGLSAASGAAVAARIRGREKDIYVFMGDGEQEKGQIAEARRFIKKYGFNNITVIVDYNKLQITGEIAGVMPGMNIAESFKTDGWIVIEINGHDFDDIFGALVKAKSAESPVMILANTVMGKGVSFMENDCKYHGSTLPADKYAEAMNELGLEPKLDYYKKLRSAFIPLGEDNDFHDENVVIKSGEPIFYAPGISTDNRSAFGAALESIVAANSCSCGTAPIAVFDCDLAPSVKTSGVAKNYPLNFFQCGISEHHASVCSGAASVNGVTSFFADFGMFGVDEVYNQQRLNAVNGADIKLVTTHVGTDVGEDGKTHMCIDYISLLRNAFGFKILVPADPNETDKIVRYAAVTKGNIHIAMGRSKQKVILDENGKSLFAETCEPYEYGKPITVRKGATPIFTYGVMLERALKIREILEEKGVAIGVINVSSPAYISDSYFNEISKHNTIFVYEDHVSSGGLFATLAEGLAVRGAGVKVVPFGVNSFAPSGTPEEVLRILGLDEASISAKILRELGK